MFIVTIFTWKVVVEITIFSSLGPSFFRDESMADQVESGFNYCWRGCLIQGLIFYLTLLFTTYLLFQVLQSQRPSHQCAYAYTPGMAGFSRDLGGLFDIRTSASFCRHMDQYVSKVSCPCWRPVGHQHLSFCTCCF